MGRGVMCAGVRTGTVMKDDLLQMK
jgi:hypothetical protein